MPLSPAVELTRRLVRENTVNPPGNESRCMDIVAPLLRELGFTIAEHRFADGRLNLVARLGRETDRPPLAFTGHVDTVPLGAAPWTRDPFAGEIDGDRLYGRGSTDMKSGVAAFMDACRLRRDRIASSCGVVLYITVAEETGCEGAIALAAEREFVGRAGALVVAEPTGNYPLVGHKGALWLRVTAEGVTAHGSMPEKGVNAVMKAARAVVRLGDFDFNVKRHEVLGAPTLNVGNFHGGLNVNSVPDRAEINLDIRTIPGQAHARVGESIAATLGDEVTVREVLGIEAIWTPPDDPWMSRVFAIMAPLIGETPVARGAPYFTDGGALMHALGGVPTVILGPGEPHLAHQTDEYCLVSRIDQAVEAYCQIIDDWCGG
ncbi:M20 family metallopeptidase [Xanthobacteraceae bacterium Astr-EGSB]|uniref:M20 family metallopeptidase n=1 Tax=Astrobacterium formosum TaxID=3069710 RepID=UPI0027B22E7A|nr:M20 family metallopeptidase [Xanthobacteraceae bacterium Astr-EGSB]